MFGFLKKKISLHNGALTCVKNCLRNKFDKTFKKKINKEIEYKSILKSLKLKNIKCVLM